MASIGLYSYDYRVFLEKRDSMHMYMQYIQLSVNLNNLFYSRTMWRGRQNSQMSSLLREQELQHKVQGWLNPRTKGLFDARKTKRYHGRVDDKWTRRGRFYRFCRFPQLQIWRVSTRFWKRFRLELAIKEFRGNFVYREFRKCISN